MEKDGDLNDLSSQLDDKQRQNHSRERKQEKRVNGKSANGAKRNESIRSGNSLQNGDFSVEQRFDGSSTTSSSATASSATETSHDTFSTTTSFHGTSSTTETLNDTPLNYSQDELSPKISGEYQNDPLFRLLNEMQTNTTTSWDPFATMTGVNEFKFDLSSDTDKQETQSSGRNLDLIWRVLRIVFCVFIGWSGNNMTIRICSGEIILYTTRFILDNGQMRNSFMYSISKYIPEPYKTYVSMSARYLRIFSQVYQDLILVLFIYLLTWGLHEKGDLIT